MNDLLDPAILGRIGLAYDKKPSFAERAALAALTLPKFYSGSLPFEPFLLKSSLFRPGSGSRTLYPTYTELSTYGNTHIEYQGEELRQDDLRTLLALLRHRSGKIIGDVIEFVARPFCRDELGWADSGDSVAKLQACILRLRRARIRAVFPHAVMHDFRLVSEASFNKECWSVWLSEDLMPILTRSLTFMKASERLAMKDGLASWLYGFIKADSCLLPFDLHAMHAAAGSTYAQKDFNRHVRRHLAAFKESGIVHGYALQGKQLRVYRTKPS
ncbi:hypothetical protein AB4156_31190 [Cupriavidus sp. 2MCAB6]|uniref:hypothetical protein n=1 Tax=Cupriavidus sp. 2MCAB6 TaxID=3232981 RepID=UPI003F8F3E4B